MKQLLESFVSLKTATTFLASAFHVLRESYRQQDQRPRAGLNNLLYVRLAGWALSQRPCVELPGFADFLLFICGDLSCWQEGLISIVMDIHFAYIARYLCEFASHDG